MDFGVLLSCGEVSISAFSTVVTVISMEPTEFGTGWWNKGRIYENFDIGSTTAAATSTTSTTTWISYQTFGAHERIRLLLT